MVTREQARKLALALPEAVEQDHHGEEVWWGKRLAAVRVDLARIEEKMLADLLADAWEGKAPRRLLEAPR